MYVKIKMIQNQNSTSHTLLLVTCCLDQSLFFISILKTLDSGVFQTLCGTYNVLILGENKVVVVVVVVVNNLLLWIGSAFSSLLL
mmetsp:Transcript_31142/g.34876  ORF Transcript_31142/g.34876 Transcript_31142/m.34876 type:complete len:85 (-) Transcript_31142:72-326(-)